MANLNKVMLIGRLTRDPETRMFANGGKVVKFGFAVNNRKKNNQSGQWEDDPVFLNVEAFNRGETGRSADLIEQNVRKGTQIFIEGHLRLDQWTSQDGQKRSQVTIVVDNFQFLDPRQDGMGGGGGQGGGSRMAGGGGGMSRRSAPQDDGPPDEGMAPPPAGRGDDDIPF
ncbi:MAG: single-stranded DNA-binding protein [Gemmataceae bacterium]